MTARCVCILALLGACAAPQPAVKTSAVDQATTEAAPDAAQEAQQAPPEAEPDDDGGDTPIRATAAMPQDGDVSAEQLVASANQQMKPLFGCVSVIRQTDQSVGSLNIEVTISESGAVAAELQSPLSAEAKTCLIDGFSNWRLEGAGSGRAMLLLTLEDTSAP